MFVNVVHFLRIIHPSHLIGPIMTLVLGIIAAPPQPLFLQIVDGLDGFSPFGFRNHGVLPLPVDLARLHGNALLPAFGRFGDRAGSAGRFSRATVRIQL